MRTVNITALAGVGFLALGAMLSVSDLALFDRPYALIMGPISWIVGCALMVAWAIGRVGLAVKDSSDESDQRPTTLIKETLVGRPAQPTSKAAAAGSHTKAVAGHVVADFLAPLAIWLIVLWFLAAIVLLLGSGPA